MIEPAADFSPGYYGGKFIFRGEAGASGYFNQDVSYFYFQLVFKMLPVVRHVCADAAGLAAGLPGKFFLFRKGKILNTSNSPFYLKYMGPRVFPYQGG